MQRLLLVAASALTLTACSTMHDMGGHHVPYAKLGKIAKEHDAQQALLLTREGKLVVVNVATGKILEPSKKRKASDENNVQQNTEGNMTGAKISDEEFAEIKRRFDHTITIKATRGSICLVDVIQPPGDVFEMCAPPDPQWW